MSTVQQDSQAPRACVRNGVYPRARRRFHRIAAVRQEQGMSLRSVSRRLGVDVRDLRYQECETTDLRLSDLYRWQKALEVPVEDLLVDPGAPLSRPVMERARLIRLMKTVVAIKEQTASEPIQRLAEMLTNQLVEVMPELEDVSAWHTVGQRRSLEEFGRAAERCFSEEALMRPFQE